MKSKVIKRQLALAVAMLLIGVITLGGVTYAWFSLNSFVEARGMKITATTEGTNFEIVPANANGTAPSNPTVWEGSIAADLNLVSAPLHPTYPVIETANYDMNTINTTASWFHSTSKIFNNPDKKVNSTDGTTKLNPISSISVNSDKIMIGTVSAEGMTAENFALVGTYWLRINAEKSGNVKITDLHVSKVEVTYAETAVNPDVNFINCVKVLVAGEDGATVIGPSSTGDSVTLIEEILPKDSSDNQLTYPVKVYVFFDGENDACTSENFDASNIDISVALTGTTVEN